MQAAGTAGSWHPCARLGKQQQQQIRVYETTTEDRIYGACTPHKRGTAQSVLENLCLNSPSVTAVKHLLPAHEMGAQVRCLKIKTWPHIFLGVRQNRRKSQENCRGTDCKSMFNFVC